MTLLVIDLDSRDAVNEWFSGPFQSYRTLTARTGRGLHLYYQQDDNYHLLRSVGQGSITKAHGLRGTEIRGVGSFVVAPPSMHRNGQRYTWLELVPPLVLPDDLRQWIEASGGWAPSRRRVGGGENDRRGGDAQGQRGGADKIRDPRRLAIWALNNLSRATYPGRNQAAFDTARALADLVDIGWCTCVQAEDWFFTAARDCGLMTDEPAKTTTLWERICGGAA